MAAQRALKIWIDLDNSPHVPFFRPIVDELRARGCTVVLTARDAFQVTQLLRLHRLDCATIGKHFGRNKAMKAVGLLVRCAQLLPWALRRRPDLAVSHGSRSQAMAARLMVVPSVVIADYEHVAHVTRPDRMIVPQAIPLEAVSRLADKVDHYPGIKEDVYAAGFRPAPGIIESLGLDAVQVIATVRPPATEAHYHCHDSETLFDAAIEHLASFPEVRIVMLPRNARQHDVVAARWPSLFSSGRMVIPAQAVDGLNLVWHSDLVVSGGGTMNREAAALGVPVYSVFRGPTGAVDRYLEREGRLVMLSSPADVRSRLVVAKRRPSALAATGRGALNAIVEHLVNAAGQR